MRRESVIASIYGSIFTIALRISIDSACEISPTLMRLSEVTHSQFYLRHSELCIDRHDVASMSANCDLLETLAGRPSLIENISL